jgi:hypothetical protein
MKKLILTFGIFLAGIFMVNAQDRAAVMTNKLVDHLKQVCVLSPDQVAKVQPIVADFVKARLANKQQYANDPAGLKAANKTARKNYKNQLSTVLSPDQIARLKAYNEQHKADKGGQGGEEDNGEH